MASKTQTLHSWWPILASHISMKELAAQVTTPSLNAQGTERVIAIQALAHAHKVINA